MDSCGDCLCPIPRFNPCLIASVSGQTRGNACLAKDTENMAPKPGTAVSKSTAGDRLHRLGKTVTPLPAAVLSFLKGTRGTPSWTLPDLAKSLRVSATVAKQAIVFLQAQGYVEPSGHEEWLTTAAGDIVSGSKPPRFTAESVTKALSELAERIKSVNQDPNAPFEIASAVAYGDFMSGPSWMRAAFS